MKVCVVQPFYSLGSKDLDRCFQEMLALIARCDDSLDVIVLPEYCDVPAATQNAEQFHASIVKYNAVIAAKAAETARRCRAIVFANFADCTETGWRNTTFAFDREGNVVGKYYKAHPAPSEVKTAEQGGNELDCSYSYSYARPTVIEIEGLRFGFMTCYDFYMYEAYAALARQNVDIVIGCSHQRTDTHRALALFGEFLSYNTNAYLLRSAVSLGADSRVCGCSMVVSPKGERLLDMKNDIGLGVCEINPREKYFKPAGFRGKPKPHYEYIDEGRRPWLYRPGGSMMVPGDASMPYPRVCAHRGFSTVAPENSLPAFGAAVALGAQEIEFDLWATRDGELVSLHDSVLDRVSDGHGAVWEHTFAELQRLDFGCKTGEHFRGLPVVTFEDILRKFACTTVMNIHVKIWDKDDEDPQFERIAALLRQYDCARHAYVMTSSDVRSAAFHALAPDIRRCVGWDGTRDDPCRIVRRAMALGSEKVQLFKPYFDAATVKLAHENGIRCNVFFADDPEEACRYLDMGVDTVLTNDYLAVANAIKARSAII